MLNQQVSFFGFSGRGVGFPLEGRGLGRFLEGGLRGASLGNLGSISCMSWCDVSDPAFDTTKCMDLCCMDKFGCADAQVPTDDGGALPKLDAGDLYLDPSRAPKAPPPAAAKGTKILGMSIPLFAGAAAVGAAIIYVLVRPRRRFPRYGYGY